MANTLTLGDFSRDVMRLAKKSPGIKVTITPTTDRVREDSESGWEWVDKPKLIIVVE